MRNFKELRIWTDGIELTVAAYTFSAILPANEKFNLVSQIQRATVSIPTNISEGSSRRSDRDFVRFLEIALGSAIELENLLIISSRIYPDSSESSSQLQETTTLLQKRIKTLMNKLE
ncbi:MAG: four helix bundle protein [Bacteroidia bacterium]